MAKSTKTAPLSKEELNQIAVEAIKWKKLDEQAKTVAKEADGIKKVLKETLVSLATQKQAIVEETSTGTIKVKTSFGGTDVELINTARVTTEYAPDAVDIIKRAAKKNPRLTRLIETTEILRYDLLEELIDTGDISTEIAQQIVLPKKGFAFSVKVTARTS